MFARKSASKTKKIFIMFSFRGEIEWKIPCLIKIIIQFSFSFITHTRLIKISFLHSIHSLLHHRHFNDISLDERDRDDHVLLLQKKINTEKCCALLHENSRVSFTIDKFKQSQREAHGGGKRVDWAGWSYNFAHCKAQPVAGWAR